MFGSRGEVMRGLVKAMAPSGPALVRAVRVAPPGGPARVRGAHDRAVRGGGDAHRARRPAGRGAAALRGAERALGRQGVPRTSPGRGDPAARTHRPRRPRRGDPADSGGIEHARRVVRERAGRAFDPEIAACLLDEADEILAPGDGVSALEETLEAEPEPRLSLDGEAIDRALSAMADFTDLIAPFLTGHSSGVASLAAAAATLCGLDESEAVAVRCAGLVHDVGRVAVPVHLWYKPGPPTADEREHVRLHPYHTERVLSRSPFPRRARADRGRPPRAPRRVGVPPRVARRRARTAGPSARGRGARGPPRRRRRRRRARGGRAAGSADRAPGGSHRAGGRGRLPARARPPDEAGRPGARDLGQADAGARGALRAPAAG